MLGVEEDTQPLAEEQPKESTSKKRKGEKQVQDNTKKKKRKKTVKVIQINLLVMVIVKPFKYFLSE